MNHGNHDNCAFRESEKWFIFDKRHNVAAEGAQDENTVIFRLLAER